MDKIKTGETTDLGFIRKLKELGVDAKAEYPASTLRRQLDEIHTMDVTFLSTNETVLKAINESDSHSEEAGTVEELIDAINDENVDRVNLTNNVELSSSLNINRDLVIDGGGNTVSSGVNAFKVKGDDVTLILKNINIETTGSAAGVRIGDSNLGTDKVNKVVLGNDAVINAETYGVTVFGEGSEVDVYGKINVTADTEGYAISGSGLPKFGGTTIVNVYEGAEIDATNDAYCIYQPQDGEVNIYGGTLRGASVIGIKSGKLNVYDGTLEATGELVDPVSGTYDGKVPTGDAIAVEVNKSYYGGKNNNNIQVAVEGGTITSTNAYKIREVNVDKSDIGIIVSGEYSVKSTLADGVNVYDDHEIVIENEETTNNEE